MKTVNYILVLALAVAATSLWADKVTLLSGSFLTGEAGAVSLDKLTFVSDELGELAIPLDKIARLESSHEHVVQFLDNSETTMTLTVADGAWMTVDGATLTKLNVADVKAIDPTPETWHGSINFSGTVTRGNTVGEAASIVGDLSRRWERDRLTASAGYYYAASGDSKETKQKTTSRFEAQAQEDHFWTSKPLYTYVNGKYEFDRLMDLKYRYRLGAGLGYQWFENEDFGFGKNSFNQELGMAYMVEKYDHLKEDDYATFRYAHHYACDFSFVQDLAFVHNFEFLPEVDDWSENYLIDTDAGLTYAFRANWQLLAKVEWDYKKKVGIGVKHSDLRYILGLGYKW